MEKNQGIIFGSWVNHYHNSEGKLLPPEKAPAHSVLASIANAEEVDWKGTFSETFFATMGWGSRSHPKAQITGYLRMPHKVFALRLPAGAYSIYCIETKHRWWKADIRFPLIPGQITYIGALHLNLYDIKKRNKYRVGKRIKKGNKCQVAIADNFNKDKELFKKTFGIFNSGLNWKTTKSLMKGNIGKIRKGRQKKNLHTIEKPFASRPEQLKPQPPSDIDVFPST